MSEEREVKRVRQACGTCRRKKTRCTGEKPICASCERLKQDCRYEPSSYALDSVGDGLQNNAALAARVALLEARLHLLDSIGTDITWSNPLPDGSLNRGQGNFSQTGEAPDIPPSDKSSPRTDTQRHDSMQLTRFSVMPPPLVLRSVIRTYFQHCHNQPYCYFAERYFLHRLENNEIPNFLLMAILAVACRFSQDPYFGNEQLAAGAQYSKSAWIEIFERSFSEAHTPDLAIVQATNMLAVVDFTNGQHKPAWVKVGLAIRFAQSLQLGTCGSERLSPLLRHERIVTFWSVYLLDRLVSCGSDRPPTINDSDCGIALPPGISDPEVEEPVDAPTIQALYDVPGSALEQPLSNFACTVFMASVLGRVERFFLQGQYATDPYPPWDARSGYMSIYSLLLDFEIYSCVANVNLAEVIDEAFTIDGNMDHPRAGHFLFSAIIWHMNHCLLAHPFFLQKLLSKKKGRVPPTFLHDARMRGLEHAHHLTEALCVVKSRGLTTTSFYGYACTVACTVHKLYTHHSDTLLADRSRRSFAASIEFLRYGSGWWTHYSRMALALLSFEPGKDLSASLVESKTYVVALDDQSLWDLLDYGWLSDAERSSTTESPNMPGGPETDASTTAETSGWWPNDPMPEITSTSEQSFEVPTDTNGIDLWFGVLQENYDTFPQGRLV